MPNYRVPRGAPGGKAFGASLRAGAKLGNNKSRAPAAKNSAATHNWMKQPRDYKGRWKYEGKGDKGARNLMAAMGRNAARVVPLSGMRGPFDRDPHEQRPIQSDTLRAYRKILSQGGARPDRAEIKAYLDSYQAERSALKKGWR